MKIIGVRMEGYDAKYYKIEEDVENWGNWNWEEENRDENKEENY